MRCFLRSRRAHALSLEALESRQLLTATPQLVADINVQESSYPTNFIEFAGRLYYVDADAQHGRELWTSDGTPEGTYLVKDINAGTRDSGISNMVVLGDHLYFAATSSEGGFELWRTDGTADGTQQVKDIAVGTSGGLLYRPSTVALGGYLYFRASDNSHGPALWKSDGTAAGTTMLKDMAPSRAGDVSDLTVVGDTLYFLGDDGVHGKELWKSDGTAAGTVLVKDLEPGAASSSAGQLQEFGGALYFTVGESVPDNTLWKSDGTAAGTIQVLDSESEPVAGVSSLTPLGDRLYFSASSPQAGVELWSTSGTDAGTQPVADLAPGAASFDPSNLLTVADSLYFTGTRNGTRELWKLAADAGAPARLATLEQEGLPLDIRGMAAFDGQLYFATDDGIHPTDLWRTDGTPAGTYPWRAQIAPPARPRPIVMGVAAGQLFYSSNVGGTGMELWRTDGSLGGTRLVSNLDNSETDSSQPDNLVTAGGFVYFTADNGAGIHLFSTSGPQGPVTQLTAAPFEMQSAGVEQLVPVDDQLFFVARDVHAQQYLGVTAGTKQSTRQLEWPFATHGIEIKSLTHVGSGVMFLAQDAALGLLVCKADAAGIQLVAALGEGWAMPAVPESAVVQDLYYFVARGTANELWRSDGTAAGTWRVRDAVPDLGLNPTQLTATSSALYFISADAMPALWKTDSTPAGSLKFADAPVPDKLIAAGDKVFFRQAGSIGSDGTAPLWVSDGTMEGTQFLTSYLDPTSVLYRPRPVAAALGGDLYFFGAGRQLMKSDGTTEGTEVVVEFLAGIANSYDIVTLGDRLYFSTGITLLASDGTADGTRTLLYPDRYYFYGVLSSNLARLGDTLYLPYPDVVNYTAGVELHTLVYTPSTVVGRHLYYSDSKFDQNPQLPASADDPAIATDKSPYFAGNGPASFQNVSSYSRGINGVVIDIANLPPVNWPLELLDAFEFRVGTSNDPSTWTAPLQPFIFSTLVSGEDGQFNRISLIWPDGAIKNTWLQITVLANDRTGLAQPDVFYFGSRVGDTGSGSSAALVTSLADELAVRNAPAFDVPITSLLDFDRDGIVSLSDALIARANSGVLPKLDLPAPGAMSLAAWPDESDVLGSLAEPVAQTLLSVGEEHTLRSARVSRGELLAFAAQSWRDWLSADDEDLLAGVFSRARRSL